VGLQLTTCFDACVFFFSSRRRHTRSDRDWSSDVCSSDLLRHVRTGRARSRADLVALTGASRNTVSARVDQLIAARLLEEGGRGGSTGGRPPTLLQFNSRAGCVLAVD